MFIGFASVHALCMVRSCICRQTESGEFFVADSKKVVPPFQGACFVLGPVSFRQTWRLSTIDTLYEDASANSPCQLAGPDYIAAAQLKFSVMYDDEMIWKFMKRLACKLHEGDRAEDIIQADLLKDLKGLAQPNSPFPIVSMIALLVALWINMGEPCGLAESWYQIRYHPGFLQGEIL